MTDKNKLRKYTLYLPHMDFQEFEMWRGNYTQSEFIINAVKDKIEKNKAELKSLLTEKKNEVLKLISEHGADLTRVLLQAKYKMVIPPKFLEENFDDEIAKNSTKNYAVKVD